MATCAVVILLGIYCAHKVKSFGNIDTINQFEEPTDEAQTTHITENVVDLLPVTKETPGF